MTNREILLSLSPCSDGLTRAAESPTLREWWETSTNRSDMMWLVGRAHSRGTLTRRALVVVSVRCCETVAHLMPTEALPHLATIGSWANGEDDASVEDINEARDALRKIRQNADFAADAAAAAAYAAAAAAAAAAYAMCDVIRDAITIDDVCAALGLDPDQGAA